MPTLKDYITFAFSAIALCLSMYNFYHSKRSERAAHIRIIEQKRYECSIIVAEAKASALRNEAALDAVRFDARLAADAELVAMIDGQISHAKASIETISEIEQATPLKEAVTGSLKEILTLELALERTLGSAKMLKSGAAEGELRTANLIADARRKLIAASLVRAQSVPAVSTA